MDMDADAVLDPDIGCEVLSLLNSVGAEIRDAWVESPVALGDGPVARYLEAMSDFFVTDEQIVLPPLVTAIAKIKG